MAEEEKKEEQASSQQDQVASDAGAQEQAPSEPEVNYQERYEQLEKEHTALGQKAKENEQLIEMVTPHVDWNAVQGGQAPAAESQEDSEAQDQFISRKAHDEAIRASQQQTDVKLLTMQFRSEHPELRDYEKTLVGPEIMRLRRTSPNLTADQLVQKATEFATGFLEKERAKGTEKADQERKAKAAETAKASGFASTGSTPPAKEEQVGETPEENVARRKEESRKRRGLTY
jgi:hypothetical protein